MIKFKINPRGHHAPKHDAPPHWMRIGRNVLVWVGRHDVPYYVDMYNSRSMPQMRYIHVYTLDAILERKRWISNLSDVTYELEGLNF
jgi:hypothetical protein